MNSIKTYNHVNRQDHASSFGISRMEEIYLKRKGQTDEPHRHDFFTVLIVRQGKGEHIIDFHSFGLTNNQVYFINPGQVHQLIEQERSVGYSITFSLQFLAHNNISLSFIDNLNLFHDFGYSPPLLVAEADLAHLADYGEQLLKTNESDSTFKYEALGALLKLLLIESNELCDAQTQISAPMDTGSMLLQSYKTLLNHKYTRWHGVAEYANELNVTSDHLNRVVKNLTGKTAKDHIQSRIIVAAKRHIYFSGLSNKELAYELGFSEPANFSAFFKNCTGLSPSDFRKKEKEKLRKSAES